MVPSFDIYTVHLILWSSIGLKDIQILVRSTNVQGRVPVFCKLILAVNPLKFSAKGPLPQEAPDLNLESSHELGKLRHKVVGNLVQTFGMITYRSLYQVIAHR